MAKTLSETQEIINKAIANKKFNEAQVIVDEAINSNGLISRYFRTAAIFLEKVNPENKSENHLSNPFDFITRHKLLSDDIDPGQIKDNFLGNDNMIQSSHMNINTFDIFKIPSLSNQISSTYLDYFDKLNKENFLKIKNISQNSSLISFYISNITKKSFPGFTSDRSLVNGIVLLNNIDNKFNKIQIEFDYIIGGPYDNLIDSNELKKTITIDEPEIIYFPSEINYNIVMKGNLKKTHMINILFNSE